MVMAIMRICDLFMNAIYLIIYTSCHPLFYLQSATFFSHSCEMSYMKCLFSGFVFPQLSVPDKVLIPERYVESDPDEALSPEQEADKQRKVDRIKALIAKNR